MPARSAVRYSTNAKDGPGIKARRVETGKARLHLREPGRAQARGLK